MASPRPKSPRTPISKNEGESFWGKIGTIGRKKRIKEGKRSKFKFLPINDWLFRVDVWLNTVFTLYGMNEFFSQIQMFWLLWPNGFKYRNIFRVSIISPMNSSEISAFSVKYKIFV